MLQRDRHRDTLNRRGLRLLVLPCSSSRLRYDNSRNRLQKIAIHMVGRRGYLDLRSG